MIKMVTETGSADLLIDGVKAAEIYNWDRSRWRGRCMIGPCTYKTDTNSRGEGARMLTMHLSREHRPGMTPLGEGSPGRTCGRCGQVTTEDYCPVCEEMGDNL